MKWKILAVGVTVLLISFIGYGVWYNNNHYTPTYDNNFLTSCEGGGKVSATTCGCALGVIKANYSYKEAKSFDTYLPDTVGSYISQQCSN